MIIGSFEVRMEERNVSFAFVRYSEMVEMSIGMVYNSICDSCEAKPTLDLSSTLRLYFPDA